MRTVRCRAIGTAIVAATILPSVSQPVVAAITTTVPSIEIRGPKGTPIRLTDFRGKVMLVKFWASWCPQCAESFAAFDAIDRDYRPRGVDVLAINVDEQRKNADAFLQARTFQVRVLFDGRARLFNAFGAGGVPAAYLVDRRGRIRHVDDDGDDSDAVYRSELDALLAEGVR